MIKTKEEILNSIKEILKDDTSDSALSLIEDLSDTLDNVKTSDETDWKTRYEENDAQWRQRYRDRFFSKPAQEEEDSDDPAPEETNEPKTFSDLFKGE
jgi:hypothetical protein